MAVNSDKVTGDGEALSMRFAGFGKGGSECEARRDHESGWRSRMTSRREGGMVRGRLGASRSTGVILRSLRCPSFRYMNQKSLLQTAKTLFIDSHSKSNLGNSGTTLTWTS